MILANVCAAQLVDKSKIPSIYRSHEKPDPLKILNLKNFLTSRQIKNNMDSYKVRENLISWMKAAKTKKSSEIINIQILRSMSLAKYDPKITSHFALSLDKYTHFTSPIRRYADLVVHRCIKTLIAQNIDSKNSKKTFIKDSSFPYSLNSVSDIAEDISIKDRNAEKISRKETKFLQCKCAENYLGQTFDGIIVSAFEFGIFIKILELNIEGFVHVSKLSKKDYLVFDESSMSMKSTKNKRSFHIGDSLKIKIDSVESFKGRVNLSTS
jgi:ribonuclease R